MSNSALWRQPRRLQLLDSYFIFLYNTFPHSPFTIFTYTRTHITMHRCSCGLFHNHQPNSCAIFFTMPYDQNICPYASSSPSSVDCTLSLATPSTRLASEDFDSPESRPSSRFCWDFLQSDNHSSVPPSYKPNRGSATNVATVDSLLARRCANCDTTSTPLWRNGPRGPKVRNKNKLTQMHDKNLYVLEVFINRLKTCSRCAMRVG